MLKIAVECDIYNYQIKAQLKAQLKHYKYIGSPNIVKDWLINITL